MRKCVRGNKNINIFKKHMYMTRNKFVCLRYFILLIIITEVKKTLKNVLKIIYA